MKSLHFFSSDQQLSIKIFWLSSLLFFSCSSGTGKLEKALSSAGKNRKELQRVIDYYNKIGDRPKLKAAYFLIENMPDQFFYTGEGVDESRKCFNKMDSIIQTGRVLNYKVVWDSLEKLTPDDRIGSLNKTKDIEILTADFLIKNIDLAFKAWNYPWNRKVSFEDFCKYILPYKLKDEEPEDFRSYFMERYKWIQDSLKNKEDSREVISLVNNDLKKWFYASKLSCPFDLAFSDLMKLKSGRCPQEVQIATYALRALGVPVVMEGVPLWANRSFRHDWNGWITKARTLPFLGTEVNPGEYKIEFARPGSIHSKRAKIFRATYEYQDNSLAALFPNEEDIPSSLKSPRFEDVTDKYLPVTDIEVVRGDDIDDSKIAYICVFNNKEWKPIHWGAFEGRSVTFNKMGRGVVYLPVVYDGKESYPLSDPIMLMDNGESKFIVPDKKSITTCTLKKKYPSGKDNEVIAGMVYELFYWNGEWLSLGKKKAQSNAITYHNVPGGALLWLRNLSEGFQERIFTLENNQQVWW